MLVVEEEEGEGRGGGVLALLEKVEEKKLLAGHAEAVGGREKEEEVFFNFCICWFSVCSCCWGGRGRAACVISLMVLIGEEVSIKGEDAAALMRRQAPKRRNFSGKSSKPPATAARLRSKKREGR